MAAADQSGRSTSYGSILSATSLIGGAQGVNLLLGLVRVKFAAVLVGPVGVGLLGNYQAVSRVFGTLAGLGIRSSGVRDVAQANERADEQQVALTVTALRRVCWLTGAAGALAMAALSVPLSRFTFGSDDHALEIASLGLVILLGNLAGGQTALIQGMRRIGDLARLNVIGGVAGTLATIGCYGTLGLAGIIPALLLTSAFQLAASWWFARRIQLVPVTVGWMDSLRAASGMARLGVAFMWAGLVASLAEYLTRAMITQQFGLGAVGIFTAAFALSGMLMNFILGAMGADYFPRLSAAARDPGVMRRLVNEQAEIGLLLAIPGLIATLSLAPWLVNLFYTSEFLPAVTMLQWFVLGCLGRVITWPLGFIVLALGKGAWFAVTQTLFHVVHLGMIFFGLHTVGLEGVAIAFPMLYLFTGAVMYLIARHLIGFRWSGNMRRLLLVLLPVAAALFLAARWLPLWPATLIGALATALVTAYSLRSLVHRVGPHHRVIQLSCRIPGMRRLYGLPRPS